MAATRLEAENTQPHGNGPVGVCVDSLTDGLQILEAKVRTLPKENQTEVMDAIAALQVRNVSMHGRPCGVTLSISEKKIDTDFNRITDFMRFAEPPCQPLQIPRQSLFV